MSEHYFESLPSGHLVEVIDQRGNPKPPPGAPYLECDFCGRMVAKLWCRPTRAFGVALETRRTIDYPQCYWVACDLCNPLAEARHLHALLARARIINANSRIIPYHALFRLYSAAFDAIAGPAVEWNGGDPWQPGGEIELP